MAIRRFNVNKARAKQNMRFKNLREFYDALSDFNNKLGGGSYTIFTAQNGGKVRLTVEDLERYAMANDAVGLWSYILRLSRRPRKRRHGLVNPHKRKVYKYRCRQMFGHTLELVCDVTYGYNAYPKLLWPKRRNPMD